MIANAATESKVRELFTSTMADVKSSLAGESFSRLILEAIGGKYAWSHTSLVEFLVHSFLSVHTAKDEIASRIAASLAFLQSNAFIALGQPEVSPQGENNEIVEGKFEYVDDLVLW